MGIAKLIAKMKEVAFEQPWYGESAEAVLRVLENPNAGLPGGNTVGQILEHTNQWCRFTLERARGNNNFDVELGSLNDWNRGKRYSNEEFEVLKKDFFQLHAELLDVLKDKDDQWLNQQVHGKPYTLGRIVEGIIDHDIAHLAQMSLLRRLKMA
ncbi:MAG: DinB family protein [Calditrichia bacterium]